MTINQYCSNYSYWLKNGCHWAEFSFYPYVKNLKKSCQKQLAQFKYNLAQIILAWPSTKIVNFFLIGRKTWLPGGRLVLIFLIRQKHGHDNSTFEISHALHRLIWGKQKLYSDIIITGPVLQYFLCIIIYGSATKIVQTIHRG